jgi:hypothetical protein
MSEIESQLDAVEARRKRISTELREVNDGLQTKPDNKGLKTRGASLVVALNKADSEREVLKKAWGEELLAGVERGAYLIESGDGAGTPSADLARSGIRSGIKGATVAADLAVWANDTAGAIIKTGRQVGFKALAAGSFDRPQMINTGLFAMPTNPARLLDLIIDRRSVPGNEYEYLVQTTRTDNAAAVVDSALKPTSVYTVTSIQDRVRVYAHLSEAIPNRILQDHQDIRQFLEAEMGRGVLDKLEADIVSGASGAVENVTGILNVTGVATTAWNTSIPVTLRKARTAMQVANEAPTAWVLNPAQAETLDLFTTADGEYIVDSSAFANIFGSIPVLVTNSVPAGQALLADWRMATLYVRESTRLDIDSSGADLFDKNLSKFRAEARVGFALNRPAAFNVIDLTP